MPDWTKSCSNRPGWASKALLSLLLIFSLPMPCAQARLGEDFAKYRLRVAKGFSPAGEQRSQESINYLFQLLVDPQQLRAAPGYAAGITITSVKGKITGQSMAVRLGANSTVGTMLAAIHGFAFAYEAIGKPLPTEKAKAEAQLKAFSAAVVQALAGSAQNLRYPGFPGLVTVARDASGNLIVAARREPAQGAGQQTVPPQPGAAQKRSG